MRGVREERHRGTLVREPDCAVAGVPAGDLPDCGGHVDHTHTAAQLVEISRPGGDATHTADATVLVQAGLPCGRPGTAEHPRDLWMCS